MTSKGAVTSNVADSKISTGSTLVAKIVAITNKNAVAKIVHDYQRSYD